MSLGSSKHAFRHHLSSPHFGRPTALNNFKPRPQAESLPHVPQRLRNMPCTGRFSAKRRVSVHHNSGAVWAEMEYCLDV